MSKTNIVLEKLPASYRKGDEQQDIAYALTAGIAAQFELWQYYIDNYEQLFLDPRTCFEDRLDSLAYQLGWRGIWDSSWTVEQKRALLINTNDLWAGRGSADTFRQLIDIFGLTADLSQDSGWKLGVDALAVDLLIAPFSYELTIPTTYTNSSREYRLIQLLIKHFTPCWGEIRITRR